MEIGRFRIGDVWKDREGGWYLITNIQLGVGYPVVAWRCGLGHPEVRRTFTKGGFYHNCDTPYQYDLVEKVPLTLSPDDDDLRPFILKFAKIQKDLEERIRYLEMRVQEEREKRVRAESR